ncbi:MAG TPA: FHA domain-containing protein [bacterium]
MITCPVCNAGNNEAEEWCVSCGWLMSQRAPGMEEESDTAIEDLIDFRAFLILPERGQVALRKARTVVGREFGDILLADDLNVSRIHFALVADGGGLYVEDLRSSNGTLLNGIKIPPGKRYLLASSDIISAGDSQIKIEFKGEKDTEEDSAGIFLIDDEGRKIRLRPGENTVGRLPLNSITIDSSPYVAREHAVLSLEKTPSNLMFLYLTDLGSSNSTYVNHKPVPAHTRIRINPSDEVTFADVTYKVLEIMPEED